MTKTVLVTGASSGIGEATVRRLLADGLSVFAAARRVERMAPLEAAGATLVALDLTDDASMVAAVAAVERAAGRLDVLVNNAGYGSYGALEDVPIEEGRRQFEVNIFGLARLTQLALPMMRAQGSGRIINVSSMGGVMREPFGAWYHATKFALEGLSDSLRVELRPLGIDVVVIQPGVIRTEWSGIAREGLLRHSGEGAYAPWARRHAADAEGGLVHLRLAAEGGGRDHRRRRARPAAAHPLRDRQDRRTFIALRRLLPDRMFDGLMWRVSQGRG